MPTPDPSAVVPPAPIATGNPVSRLPPSARLAVVALIVVVLVAAAGSWSAQARRRAFHNSERRDCKCRRPVPPSAQGRLDPFPGTRARAETTPIVADFGPDFRRARLGRRGDHRLSRRRTRDGEPLRPRCADQHARRTDSRLAAQRDGNAERCIHRRRAFRVLDGRANRLILFGSTGAVLATYGRRSSGADSLRAPSPPKLAADGTLWLIDLPSRVIRLDADLRPISQTRIGPKDPVLATIMLLVGSNAIAVENDFGRPKVADAAIHRGKRYFINLKPNGADRSRRGQEVSGMLTSRPAKAAR